jgi:hypothetical protein
MLVCVPDPVCHVAIGFGGGQLHRRQRMDDRHRHPVVADAKIAPRPFGLRAPAG